MSADLAPRLAPAMEETDAEAGERLLHHGIPALVAPPPPAASTVVGRLARWIWASLLGHLDRFRQSNESGEIVIRIPISYGKPTKDVMIDAKYCTRRPIDEP